MKKWMRRPVALVLCMILLISTSMVSVQAETSDGLLQQESFYRVNPLFEGTDFAAEAEDEYYRKQPLLGADKSLEYKWDYWEAVADLTAQLANHDETCWFAYADNGALYAQINSLTGDAKKELLFSFMDDAMLHTGVPDEGDYLQFNYQGASLSYSCRQNGYAYNYTLTYTPDYFTTLAQENQTDAAVEALLDELNVYDAGQYEKVEAVYDWICANIVYDDAGLAVGDPMCHSTYAAIVKKTAVCQGYATLLYRMLLELGIDNRVITSFDHAWNIVEVEPGSWQYYNCDATWDAGATRYRYFLAGENAFEADTDHYRSAQYDTEAFHDAYPMAWAAYTPGQEYINVVPGSLSLSTESIVMYNLYIDIENLPKGAKIDRVTTIVYDHDPAYDEEYNPTARVQAVYTGKNNRYMAQVSAGAAKKMGDMLWFEPYVVLEDGSFYWGRVVSSSVINYSQKILQGEYSEEMKALSVAMLNYGTAAQNYLDYRTDEPINRSLKAEQSALAQPYSADMLVEDVIPDTTRTVNFARSAEGSGEVYGSLSLDDAIAINYYYAPTYTPDEGSVKLYLWDYDTFWDTDMTTKENADLVLDMTIGENGLYFASMTGLAAKQIDDTLYASIVYTSGGKTYCAGTVPHSVNSYCAYLIENSSSEVTRELAKAIVVYGYYANAYFD